MNILAIESSCDETAAAVVADGRRVCSNIVSTQIDLHRIYGGVVPEIASRKHIESIDTVVEQALEAADCALEQIDAIAVTAFPGLIGALLVGVNFAKGLAFASGKPLVPVHHIRGHIAANYIAYPDLEPPFLCLVVSGGHTNLVLVEDYTSLRILGRTRDDAAGECFDKVARVLGLPYPGGVSLDRLTAQTAAPGRYRFPHAKVADCPLDFSFSGLKTAAINLIHNAEQKGEPLDPQEFGADFSDALVGELVSRLALALEETGARTVAIAGGVSANSRLRAAAEALCAERGLRLCLPPLSLCGDNAAMIGAAGYYEYLAGARAPLSLNASATRSMEKSYIE